MLVLVGTLFLYSILIRKLSSSAISVSENTEIPNMMKLHCSLPLSEYIRLDIKRILV